MPPTARRLQRIRFDSLELAPAPDAPTRATVVLDWKGTRFVGQADVPDRPQPVARCAAAATLNALETIMANYAIGFRLQDLNAARLMDSDVLLVGASMDRAGSTETIARICPIRSSETDAAVRAVLNATNRALTPLLT